MEKIEYRVRPVTRYIVTRYQASPTIDGTLNRAIGKSETKGEFDNAETAYAVGYALCKEEHERLGFPPSDERVQYPQIPVTGQIGGERDDQFPLNKVSTA